MSQTNRPRKPLSAVWLEFLGSMNLAVTLLMVVAIASVIGTVLQQGQPWQDYQIKFGPFWFDVFRVMGLYDVYSSLWFLGIMGFLLVSVSTCVVRNGPQMIRDMRNYRMDVQGKSLRLMHNSRTFDEGEAPEAVTERARGILQAAGYRARTKDQGDHVIVAGMRGSWNRLGYILSHVSIVIICIGALVDGNLPLKLAEMTGRVELEKRDIPASQVPDVSTLGSDNLSFRGNVTIPEGASADLIFLNMRDGYFVQKLPFDVELEEFRVEHYESGQPKSFESDLVVRDPELDEPIRKTISVNDPLIHKGYAIYQSSFTDGGSQIELDGYPLMGGEGEPFDVDVKVNNSATITAGDERMTLEVDGFDLYNVEPAAEGSDRKFRNFGPSVTYRLRDESGDAREYETYMAPAEFNGRSYYMTGVRTRTGEPMRWLHVPVDPETGGLDRFVELRNRIQDDERVREAAETFLDENMGDALGDRREGILRSTVGMVDSFVRGGLDAMLANVEEMAGSEEEARRMGELYQRVLDGVIREIYNDLLADEDRPTGQDMTEDDAAFYGDALDAMTALPFHGAPFLLKLEDFDHVQASGLQIARSPGKNTVYLGSALLTAGIFLLFYVSHRRVWVRVEANGSGSQVTVAGSTNRNARDFVGEFRQLADRIQGVEDPGTGDRT
ncbi:MAG: cytochrome c biogenesis protein ResB [Thiohalospira sp.]